MGPPLALVLSVLMLGLAACGGGSDGDSGQDGNAQAPVTQTRPEEEQHGPTGDQSQLDLGNDEPAPPVSKEQRKKEPDLPRGAPKPKVDLKPKERQIYELSRYFCRQAGIEGMRREYGIESADPEDIAREAARRTYGRGGAEPVYAGCLAGLRKTK